MKKLSLISFLLSFFFHLSYAQLPDIEFENYSTADGLGAAWNLTHIVQDQDGYLWLASLDGLIRFDGYDFKVYKNDPQDSTSLSVSTNKFFVDSKNRLWLTANPQSGGMFSLYNSESDNFTHFRELKNSMGKDISSDSIYSPYGDSNGLLWFTSGKKIYSFDPETNIVSDSLNDSKITPSLKNRDINFFQIDSKQNFWIVVNSDLIKYNPGLNSIDVFKFIGKGSPIITLYEDPDGEMFVGGNNSCLNVYDSALNALVELPTQSGKYKYVQAPISKGNLFGANGLVSLIKRTTNGNLWIGTVNGGIKVYNKNLTEFKYFSPDHQKAGLSFTGNLFEDNQKNLWIPTFNQGLLKVVPSRSIFTLSGNGLAALENANAYSIRGIYESKDRTIWIGTSDGRLLTYNPVTKKTQFFDSKSKDKNKPTGSDFQAFYEDPDGIMWIASSNGVIKYNPKNGKFSKAVFDIDNQLSESNQDIEMIIGDDDGDYIWIATWGEGIFKHNRKTLQTINYRNDTVLLGNRIWSMIKTRSGDICVGTVAGLFILNKPVKAFQKYFSQTSVNSIHEDKQGNFWLSTRQGIYTLSPQKELIKHYSKRDGLPSDMIGGILGDDNNMLWIGTGRGLVRFNPEDESILVFDEEEGALIDLFETGNSYYKTQEGLLLFGSSSRTGITAFNPEKIKYNPYPPNVLITDLNVFDNEKDSAFTIQNLRGNDLNKIELSYRKNDLIFNYVGIHFKNPKKNKYKYKLENYDRDWKDAGTLRSARYTSLDPGEYTFQVMACNSDGIWNPKPAALNVIILPPWWKTWWAYVLYVLFAFGLLYSARRVELNRRKEKENKRILELENKRKSKELEEARQLQLSMLPKELPQLPHLDIAVYMQTATEVGGDYYDFHVGMDGTLTVVIGDATGHGMKAGTMVTTAKSLFKTHASNPDILFSFQEFTRCIKEMNFGRTSMCLTMLKISDHALQISTAGMPPTYIYRSKSGKVEEYLFKGMPLGAMDKFPYELKVTILKTGDTILLLSDGLPELENNSGTMYGYSNIQDGFKSVAEKSSEAIIEYFKNEGASWVDNSDPDDDVTFVVIKVK